MKLSQFKFKLPEEKIALHPTKSSMTVLAHQTSLFSQKVIYH